MAPSTVNLHIVTSVIVVPLLSVVVDHMPNLAESDQRFDVHTSRHRADPIRTVAPGFGLQVPQASEPQAA